MKISGCVSVRDEALLLTEIKTSGFDILRRKTFGSYYDSSLDIVLVQRMNMT